jgi:hypothetical protein
MTLQHETIARAAISAALLHVEPPLRVVRTELMTGAPSLARWLAAGEVPEPAELVRRGDSEGEVLAAVEAGLLLEAAGDVLAVKVRTGEVLLRSMIDGSDMAVDSGGARMNFRWSENAVLCPALNKSWGGVFLRDPVRLTPANRIERILVAAMGRRRVQACFDADGYLVGGYSALWQAMVAEFPANKWGESAVAFREIILRRGGRSGRTFWEVVQERGWKHR